MNVAVTSFVNHDSLYSALMHFADGVLVHVPVCHQNKRVAVACEESVLACYELQT